MRGWMGRWVGGRGEGGGGGGWCYTITGIIAWRRATVSVISCFIYSWLLGRRRVVNIFARQHQNKIWEPKGELNRIQTSCRVSLSGHLTTADPDLHPRWYVLLSMLAVHQGISVGSSCTGNNPNLCTPGAMCDGGICSEFLFQTVYLVTFTERVTQTQNDWDCLFGNVYWKSNTDIEWLRLFIWQRFETVYLATFTERVTQTQNDWDCLSGNVYWKSNTDTEWLRLPIWQRLLKE